MIENIADMVELANGMKMPGFGFGCYKAEGSQLQEAILTAAEAGYRLFDTASYYKNEGIVGQTVKRLAQTPFLVSKIWPCDFDKPVKALDKSLKELEVEKLDGYLLHWPGLSQKLRLKAYETLLRQQEQGKIGILGVSNFMRGDLEEISREFGFWPPVNQVECHPYFPQKELCDFCQRNLIQVMAWSPLGRGGELADPVILAFSEEVNATSAQIILRWHIQNNVIPIPKSVHAKRIRENAHIFDFTLDEMQMLAIASLAKKDGRLGPDPADFPKC